jgi:hypothetical protein
MDHSQTITLARAVRHWDDSIHEATLVWRCFDSKLGVEYRQVSDCDHLSNDIPDQDVKNWLWIFVRPSEHCRRSFCITEPLSAKWLMTINELMAEAC